MVSNTVTIDDETGCGKTVTVDDEGCNELVAEGPQ